MIARPVLVVLCIDTEGPCVDPGREDLLPTWEQVDSAMDRLFDPAFRARQRSPDGRAMRVGWFFLSWTGFTSNPRGRDMGYHRIRDHYLARWGGRIAEYGDEQCWHYHHPAASGVGNEWGLDWSASSEYAAILSRSILERNWFPACFRAGGTILDPASSAWVDRWFPIDYSNRAPVELPGLVDWSNGVAEWALYSPAPGSFLVQGAGRRRMARSLDLASGAYQLTNDDIEQAFERASGGLPTILSTFDHDYRDIAGRVDELRGRVSSVAARYPRVPWRYAAPAEAIREYLELPRTPDLTLEASHFQNEIMVWAGSPVHQAVPWVAVRSKDGSILHDETWIERIDATRWRWRPPEDLDWVEVGFGASTESGSSATIRISPDDVTAGFLDTPPRRHGSRPWSIWEHSKVFPRTAIERVTGIAEPMDSLTQAAEIIGATARTGDSILDVGCAGGHAWLTVCRLGLTYHGIDPYRRAIEIGRHALAAAGLPSGRLRAIELQELPADERYDFVMCLNTLCYFPDLQQPLDIMTNAARRMLVIRSSFGDRDEIRYLPDVLLEPPFRDMRAYFSIFSRSRVERFLTERGFAVRWVADRRQRERFGGSAEVVGGISLPAEWVVAERLGSHTAPPR